MASPTPPIGLEVVVGEGGGAFANFPGVIQDLRRSDGEILVQVEINVFGRPTPIEVPADNLICGERSLSEYLAELECVMPDLAPDWDEPFGPDHQPIPCAHANFNDAFVDGAVFVTAKRKTPEEFTIEVRQVGTLVVPSGQIIAAEPVQLRWRENQRPFTQTVHPGEYPVWISLAEGSPACLMIKFTDQTAARWELALKAGQDPRRLDNGQFYGYGVDAGTGGFVDGGAVALLAADKETLEAALTKIDEASLQDLGPTASFECVLDESTGANVIGCIAGYGDGCYPSYWGFDEQGNVACLATDFHILLEGQTEELTFDEVEPLVGQEIEDERLAASALRHVRLIRCESGQLGFDLVFEGNPSLEARLVDANGETIADTRTESFSMADKKNHARLRWSDPTKLADAKLVLTFPGRSLPLQRRIDQ